MDEGKIELKYAPRKCRHSVMGDCLISENDRSCHYDCDVCDVYFYYNQAQDALKKLEKIKDSCFSCGKDLKKFPHSTEAQILKLINEVVRDNA